MFCVTQWSGCITYCCSGLVFLSNDGCFVSLWRRVFWWFWCNKSGIIWSWLAKHCWLTCKSHMCVYRWVNVQYSGLNRRLTVETSAFFCFLESSLADVRLDGGHIIIFNLSLRLSVTVTMVTIKPCTAAPSPVSSRKPVTGKPMVVWHSCAAADRSPLIPSPRLENSSFQSRGRSDGRTWLEWQMVILQRFTVQWCLDSPVIQWRHGSHSLPW